MKPLRSIIIESVDRLGKDTLIKALLDKLGFMQVVHYQKPMLLSKYVEAAKHSATMTYKSEDDLKSDALKAYQFSSFETMFKMLGSDGKFILNRAHLGEMVYAHRYRGYDGAYIYFLEESWCPLDEVLLILLHTSDFSFIADDGESFNFDQKEEEQLDFVRAFERSKIKHKLMIDVSAAGDFVPKNIISNGVVQAFMTIQSMDQPVWDMSWSKNGDTYTQVNNLMPDPRTLVT